MSSKLLLPLLLLLAGCASAPPAPSPAPPTPEHDAALLQGRWYVVSARFRGQEVPPEKIARITIIVEGDKINMKTADSDDLASFALDLSKKPRWITLTHADKPAATNPGIYSLEGETFKLCWGAERGPRPTDFISTAENKFSLMILKRTPPPRTVSRPPAAAPYSRQGT